MSFHVIDMEQWDRRECFEHFMTVAKSSYSITINMDITKLYQMIKKQGLRLYPTFTWIVSRAVNNHQEFQMGYDEHHNLGYYDVVSPDYSVLNEKTKIMDSLCTPYCKDFQAFYAAMVHDLTAYKERGVRTGKREDSYIASCVPWMSYSSFTASNESGFQFLFPMVTWGKFYQQEDKVFMPVTLQIHHAAADGYHCSLFFDDVEEVLQQPELYLLAEGDS